MHKDLPNPHLYLRFSVRKMTLVLVLVVGLLAGLAADIDVVIRSSENPLLRRLEFYRQFTYSLLFIPLGGLVVTLALQSFLRGKTNPRRTWVYSDYRLWYPRFDRCLCLHQLRNAEYLAMTQLDYCSHTLVAFRCSLIRFGFVQCFRE